MGVAVDLFVPDNPPNSPTTSPKHSPTHLLLQLSAHSSHVGPLHRPLRARLMPVALAYHHAVARVLAAAEKGWGGVGGRAAQGRASAASCRLRHSCQPPPPHASCSLVEQARLLDPPPTPSGGAGPIGGPRAAAQPASAPGRAITRGAHPLPPRLTSATTFMVASPWSSCTPWGLQAARKGLERCAAALECCRR